MHTVTVKFYNGKTLHKSHNVICGKAATAPKNPSKTGYTFTGWDKSFNKVTKNLTVNAVFKESAKSYTVKFYNGSKLLKEQIVKSDKSATAPKDPSKSGYIFTGWDKAFNKVAKDLIVNAVFKPNATTYTVSFNTGGGLKVASQTVKSGDTVKKPKDPTREGYIFAGWYSDPGFKTLYSFSVKVTKSIIIYAKWEKYSNNSKILPDLAEVMENSHADDLILIWIWRDSTTNDFIDKYVNKSRAVHVQSTYTGTIILEATSADIIKYAGINEVQELSFCPRIPDVDEIDSE